MPYFNLNEFLSPVGRKITVIKQLQDATLWNRKSALSSISGTTAYQFPHSCTIFLLLVYISSALENERGGPKVRKRGLSFLSFRPTTTAHHSNSPFQATPHSLPHFACHDFGGEGRKEREEQPKKGRKLGGGVLPVYYTPT